MSVLLNLLHSVVDYAGLFPPASLPMNPVVENYAKYLKSNENAMLGRLIIPASKLDEFDTAAVHLLPTGDDISPWRISALIPPIEQNGDAFDSANLAAALKKIQTFNDSHRVGESHSVIVDAIEVKANSAELISQTIEALPAGLDSFLEIAWLTDPTECIAAIQRQPAGKHIFAKIRTGGVTEELIPPCQSIARFITAAAQAGVGFKATAGLHHPVRSLQPLTYETDAPQATMHGYLNVFVATMFAFEHRVDQETLYSILSNEDPQRFEFDDNGLKWESLVVSSDRISEIRTSGIISFGSCSFAEPTSELQGLPNVTRKTVFSS
jgi:hypothetical protein